MARGRATASNAKKKSKPPSRAKGTHRRHRVRAHDTGHDEPVERTSGHEAAGDAAGSGQGGFSWEAFLTSDDPPPGPGDTGSSVAELEAFLMSDDPPWLQRHTEWREGRAARERAREEAWAERERRRMADPEAFRMAEKAAWNAERFADLKENAPEKYRQHLKNENERMALFRRRAKEQKQAITEQNQQLPANDLEAFLMSDDPPWLQRHTAWREGRPARERAREEARAERERQWLADPEAFRRAEKTAEQREWRADVAENRQYLKKLAIQKEKEGRQRAITERKRRLTEKANDLEAFLTPEPPPWLQRHTEWREGWAAREQAREEAHAERERQRLADPEAFRMAQKTARDREYRADMAENAPEKYRQYLKGGQERKASIRQAKEQTGNLPLQGQPSYKELKAEMVAERENRSSATSPPPTTTDAPRAPTNVNQGPAAEVQRDQFRATTLRRDSIEGYMERRDQFQRQLITRRDRDGGHGLAIAASVVLVLATALLVYVLVYK
eukprot:jgi/Mesvir1/21546/Mv03986-RA.1